MKKRKTHVRGSALSHLERAERLRAAGFNVHLRKGRQIPQLKSAVTRLFKQHAHFLNPSPGTSPVKFFKLTPAQRRLASKTVSKKSLSPGGFWIQLPKGVKSKDYKVKIDKYGVREAIKGRQNDRIIPLSRRSVARDPIKAFRVAVEKEQKRSGKKARQAQLIVNGFQGKRIQSLKSMLWYLENSPRFAFETEELDEDEFEDTFQLKLIYGQNTKKRKKGKKVGGLRR